MDSLPPIVTRKPKYLKVTVIEAKSIPAMDFNGYSDPYCTLKLSGTVFKTKTIFKNLNPEWHETFVFDLSRFYEEKYLLTKLLVTIYDFDGFQT